MAIVVIGDKASGRHCPCEEPCPDASGRHCVHCRLPVREGTPGAAEGAGSWREPVGPSD